MTWGWIETPGEFTQGSSIMPQKRNPVVLEHMVSMAGMAVADATSVLNNVSAAWWEDSNNATTDVQVRLWESNDRALRFFKLMEGLMQALTVATLPAEQEIVAAGATTTAAADVLAAAGIPFRGAHNLLGTLIKTAAPADWTSEHVLAAAGAIGVGGLVDERLAERMIDAALHPDVVLSREQADGPGSTAVRSQVRTLRAVVCEQRARAEAQGARLRGAESVLDSAVATLTS